MGFALYVRYVTKTGQAASSTGKLPPALRSGAPGGAPTLGGGTMSVAEHNLTDRITYDDLYRRWEQNNWSAYAIDFSRDRVGWDALTDLQRESALCMNRVRNPASASYWLL